MGVTLPVGKDKETEVEVRKTTYEGGGVVLNTGDQAETFLAKKKPLKTETIRLKKEESDKLMREPKKWKLKKNKVILKGKEK